MCARSGKNIIASQRKIRKRRFELHPIDGCSDLAPVIAEFARLFRPGGVVVVVVVMPRVSLWEIGALLKGHFRLAFRRFRPGGVLAQVEEGGPTFRTWYFSPPVRAGRSVCTFR